ncbi:hypothetical protein BJX96DRAFT_141733 [Aspergillus floccosus]
MVALCFFFYQSPRSVSTTLFSLYLYPFLFFVLSSFYLLVIIPAFISPPPLVPSTFLSSTLYAAINPFPYSSSSSSFFVVLFFLLNITPVQSH